ADLTLEQRQTLLLELAHAATVIPSVRRFRAGKRIRHGFPGYEQIMPVDFQYAALMEFDDRAGLEQYLRHPAHAAIGSHFTASAVRALAYDFQMTDAADGTPADFIALE
ncbi:MAG: Dabb family protein, partial [Acidobacteria bacterium]|nr:Dabb family protein [Acidobacteriota bacterium]